jgi:sortase A
MNDTTLRYPAIARPPVAAPPVVRSPIVRRLRPPRRPRGRALTAALLLVAAGSCVTQAAWIGVEAKIAQLLLATVWERRLDGAPRPGAWTAALPLVRLSGPRGESVVVLADSSSDSLAFGPGHVRGTARPGERGHSVVVGHSDTHFAFLERLTVGDELVVERADRHRVRYRVEQARVADERDGGALRRTGGGLTLVTCWPFGALDPTGELRWVVEASAVAEPW